MPYGGSNCPGGTISYASHPRTLYSLATHEYSRSKYRGGRRDISYMWAGRLRNTGTFRIKAKRCCELDV